jgi:thiamine-phosphate pyrophosphorylase
MLVTDRHRSRRDLAGLIEQAVGGGVGIVQIREKDLDDDAIRDLVTSVRARLPISSRITVNGRSRVARDERVGLHLPAGHHLVDRSGIELYGRSAHGVEGVRAAVAERVDYVIVGTIFETPSKPGLVGAGLDFLRETCEAAGGTPVYAIGGMHISNVPDVIHAGAWGVAVTGAISGASDPGRVAQAFVLALEVAVGRQGA